MVHTIKQTYLNRQSTILWKAPLPSSCYIQVIMVESQLRAQPNPRLDRPSSGGYFTYGSPQAQSPMSGDTSFPSPGFSSAFSAGSDDNENITTPTLVSVQSTTSSGHNNITPQNSVAIHASMDMSDQSLGDPSRPGPYRRRSRSQAVNQTRSSTSRTPQSPSAHGYPSSIAQTSDNRHLTAFQGPPTSYSTPTSVPYSHRPELLTQYTMSTPPGLMGMSHSPSYVYSPSFHPSMDHPQNPHGNYPSMMQSSPMYQYPASTVDHAAASIPGYSGSRSPSMYASTSPNTQPPSSPPHLMTSQQQGTTISGVYIGPGSYQTIGYPSTSPYTYTPTVYPARFPPSSFTQPFPRSTESEPQGTWFYLPYPQSVPSPQPYDSNPPYQAHYGVHFPQMGQSRIENRFSVPTSSQRHANLPYSIPPNRGYHPHLSQTPSSPEGRHGSMGPYTIHQLPSTPSASSGSEPLPPGDRSVMRQPYHPNPPAHRSEWVMWAGNVPPDATHDELWKFFNLPPNDPSSAAYHSGVLSIFLISRSSCAFVNYDTEVTLLAAISRFNGVPLRGHDHRCPRMVCRVRKKDDDLKAGVGGQRGMGMHTRWVKQQKGKGREVSSNFNDVVSDDPSLSSSTSASGQLAYEISNVSLSSDEDGQPRGKQSSGSGSFTSTNSSFLVRYFPQRYFILKSLTQHDLDLSVERGVWATQKHNEGILDQAYRTSKNVFLIFSVNKSGEFYGYARMSGPVRRGEQTIAWASRRPESSAGSRSNVPSSRGTMLLASDGRQVDSSPLPLHSPSAASALDPHGRQAQHHASAPPLMGKRYHLPTIETPGATFSLDPRYHFLDGQRGQQSATSKFELDRSAPVRAMRKHQRTKSSSGSQDLADTASFEAENEDQLQEDRRQETWGDCFAVQWVSTSRLPFHRTRHLRNPWNHDREVKVSRDGTELEPSVGQRLMEEWEKLADLAAPLPGGSGPSKPPTGKKASKSPQTPGSAPPSS